MKRLFPVLFLMFLVAASAGPRRAWAMSRKPPLPSAPITAVVDGRIRNDIEAVTVQEAECLSLGDVRRLFGGKEAWKRVSRKVEYEAYGNTAEFTLGSSSAVVNGREVALETSIRWWSGDAYIPLSFLATEEFQQLTGNTVRWDATTRSLAVEPHPSVGSPFIQTLARKSRVEMEISPRVKHEVKTEPGKVLIRVTGGSPLRNESVEIKDGLVNSVWLRSEGKNCYITIDLAEEAAEPQIRLVAAPRRLVMEVMPKDVRHFRRPEGVVPVSVKEPLPEVPVPAGEEAPLTGPDMTTLPVETLPEPYEPPAAPLPSGPAVPIPAEPPSLGPSHEAILSDIARSPIKTIVVDAGHGGKDTGAVGRGGTLEKDINLTLARALAQILRRERRFNVILTRDSDVFIPLQERTEIANKKKADLFVSIHCNAAMSKRSTGFEVYFLSESATDAAAEAVARRENAVMELEGLSGKAKQKVHQLLLSMAKTETMNESSEVAALIAAKVKQALSIPNRGVKQANFYVLRGADMPAVLVESAFITHSQEERYLGSSRFQNKLVEALHEGILAYEKRKIQGQRPGDKAGG